MSSCSLFSSVQTNTVLKYFSSVWIQDPSSPRSVQSYSSRENGLDKMPPSRKDGPPQASPTSLASSSSAASPSRGKEPPQVETDASDRHNGTGKTLVGGSGVHFGPIMVEVQHCPCILFPRAIVTVILCPS